MTATPCGSCSSSHSVPSRTEISPHTEYSPQDLQGFSSVTTACSAGRRAVGRCSGGRGKEESAAGEQPAEGGEKRTGRGGDGCFGISNIPYLFSINKFNCLYLMHLITCFGPFWPKKKKFKSKPINIKRFH